MGGDFMGSLRFIVCLASRLATGKKLFIEVLNIAVSQGLVK
jgi:hypothetical protein